MTQTIRQSEAGFTLIEALVAMVILGLGAVSLMSAAEGYTGRISDVTDRVAARWVAENALVEARLGFLRDGVVVEMYGQHFDVVQDLSETHDPDLTATSLRVSQTLSGRQLFVLDGFVVTQVPL
jgi:general secretion pathway protein I